MGEAIQEQEIQQWPDNGDLQGICSAAISVINANSDIQILGY
jgi:hypothetical protein